MPKRQQRGIEPVSQKEIKALLGLKVLIRQRWNFYRKDARGIISRLEAGAAIEGGPHTAKVESVQHRGRSVRVLSLDGRPGLLDCLLTAANARKDG